MLDGYLDWLRGHDVSFDVATDLRRVPDHDGPLIEGIEDRRPIELDGIPPFVEHRDPDRDLAADHGTLCLAAALLRGGHLRPGCRFWDIGCGTGVLAVVAGLAGARCLIATDVDPRAIRLAQRTASEADVNVRFCEGSLLKPVPGRLGADVVAANLPHKPVPAGFSLPVGQDGGEEGDAVHVTFAAQVHGRLEPGAKVFFFLHSLPHPRLLHAYQAGFDLELQRWKRRFLGPHEYGALRGHFFDRARAGLSWVAGEGDRRYLIAGVWTATRR